MQEVQSGAEWNFFNTGAARGAKCSTSSGASCASIFFNTEGARGASIFLGGASIFFF